MPLPQSREARDFYQSAVQRMVDAEFLLKVNRTTAAVYLGGYAVECALKALLIDALAGPKRKTVLKSFRGTKAHDFAWLRKQYYDYGGPQLPTVIARAFVRVGSWTTDLRYQPGRVLPRDARQFVQAVRVILTWAEGRF
jgi:hypothetical protein